jgi:glycosyltransferase involved in cell wall biosynthesis
MFILEQEHVNLILQDCTPTSPAYRPPLPANEPPHVRSAGLLNRLKKSIRAVARGLVRLAPAYSREDLRWTLFFALRFLRAIRIRAANPSFESSSKERTPDVSAPDHVRNRIHAQLAVVARPCARDVFWTCGHLLPLRWVAEQKRLDQFRVVAMGYDVIRARYPEWNPPDAPRDLFVAQIVDLLDAADLIYCISKDTRRGLSSMAVETTRSKPRLKLVRLGADLPLRGLPSGGAMDRQFPQLVGRRFALAVGTVEARKNYALLLIVWRVLCQESDFDLDLVIVGRPGWGAATSIEEIRTSPLLGKRIFWLENCPDSVLSGLYDRCSVVLCPSLMEGWGLPVAEGLAHGKQVVCSNRGALPEAGMGAAIVLDATDWAAWTEVIRSASKTPARPSAAIDLPTWDAAADRICRGLIDMARSAGER